MYYANDSKWASKVEKFVDFIFPMSTYCIICGNFVDNTRKYSLCDNCIEKIDFGFIYLDMDKLKKNEEIYFDSAISCMKYGLLEREIGTALKYRKETYISRIIAEIMFDRIINDENVSEYILNSDLIIPVPISKKRRIERGFNQTEKIAKHLSKKIGVKVNSNILFRVKETEYQKKLSKEERILNLEAAFICNSDLDGKNIILLDDFYTTGATVNAISKELKKSKAKEIHILTLATRNKYAEGFFRKY